MTALFASQTWKHALWEFRLNIRNGEQVLLLILIPLIVLITLTQTSFIGGQRWDISSAFTTVITISTLAAGFTSLAIATAFERRSGALAFMGTTPLSRGQLVIGKGLATYALSLGSTIVLGLTSIAFGLELSPTMLVIPAVLILGILSVSGFAFFIAGTIRAEAVLALANGIFLVVIFFGGVIFALPSEAQRVLEFFPPLALKNLLDALTMESMPTNGQAALGVIVLTLWAVVGNLAAARFFKWR